LYLSVYVNIRQAHTPMIGTSMVHSTWHWGWPCEGTTHRSRVLVQSMCNKSYLALIGLFLTENPMCERNETYSYGSYLNTGLRNEKFCTSLNGTFSFACVTVHCILFVHRIKETIIADRDSRRRR